MKVKTIYIANDGTEFKTREECMRYEMGYREQYFDILGEINYMKSHIFKEMERNLAEARDKYRFAAKNGIVGNKTSRFEKMTELRFAYIYAKRRLKTVRKDYNIKRDKLNELGILLGFRKSVLCAHKEKQLKGEAK